MYFLSGLIAILLIGSCYISPNFLISFKFYKLIEFKGLSTDPVARYFPVSEIETLDSL